MRTRSQIRNQQQQQIPPIIVESLDLEDLIKDQESPVVTMADNRTMAELLQAPTEGYEDAIVVPAITADNFELKDSLLTLVQNKQFFGHDKEDPHAHIRYFNKITSTMRFPNVPNTSIKLMLFDKCTDKSIITRKQSKSILTVEEGAGTFTVHPSFPKLPRYQIRGQIQIKGCVGQFKEAQAQMQGQISLIKGILILAQAQCHVSHGESTNLCGFCAKLTHKTNTNVTSKNASLAILRCPQINPTATIDDQMIKAMNARIKSLESKARGPRSLSLAL
ncbi:hypothetical protein Tco_1262202 [Tanacetum coccineum]